MTESGVNPLIKRLVVEMLQVRNWQEVHNDTRIALARWTGFLNRGRPKPQELGVSYADIATILMLLQEQGKELVDEDVCRVRKREAEETQGLG